MRINGEIEGIKKSILEALDALYDLHIPNDCLWSEELISEVSFISSKINREISLYIDRKGRIIDVSVGNNNTVNLQEVEGKRSLHHLSGIKCIHTHPSGVGQLSSVDISSLKLLRLDAMIAVGVVDGRGQEIYVGILSSENTNEVDIFGPYSPDKKDFTRMLEHITLADKNLRDKLSENLEEVERAILVGLQTRGSRDLGGGLNEADVSLLELEELTKTAGAMVVGRLMQKRDTRNSSTVVGQGKIQELGLMAQALQADVIIFDVELTGAQLRNIEAATGKKVLSRTSLILDIFAQRARSREGLLQVELAQIEYRLPRLMGMGLALSRIGGGIGTKGPGETKLETDRRTIRTRIAFLKEQLEDISRQRGVLRSQRKNNGIPVVSIVGYTNAGKSTLLNTLCEADVLAEDKLFATLDTTTRKLELNDGRTALLTDTVGFIRKLPHNLLDAFKSTLEEVVLSDLILIVADASDPQVADHVRIVDEILAELGADSRPAIVVLNKIDRAAPDNTFPVIQTVRQVIEISAQRGDGLDELKLAIEKMLFSERERIQLAIPFSEGAIMSWLHANGKIFGVSYDENTNLVDVELDKTQLAKVAAYIVNHI